jgi:hypothetical protein
METARNVKLYVSYTFFFEACQLLIRKKIIQFKHTLVLRSKCSRGVTLMTDSVLTFDLWHARVVSYYGSQPLNQACNLLIDSPVSKSTETSNVRHGKHMALAGRKYKKQKIQLRGVTSYEKVTTVKSSHPICHVKGNVSQRKSSLRWVFTMQKLAAKLVFQLLALHQQRAPSCRGPKESHMTIHRVPFKHWRANMQTCSSRFQRLKWCSWLQGPPNKRVDHWLLGGGPSYDEKWDFKITS